MSAILESMYEAAKGLHRVGAMEDQTMRKVEQLCLEEGVDLSKAEKLMAHAPNPCNKKRSASSHRDETVDERGRNTHTGREGSRTPKGKCLD